MSKQDLAEEYRKAFNFKIDNSYAAKVLKRHVDEITSYDCEKESVLKMFEEEIEAIIGGYILSARYRR